MKNQLFNRKNLFSLLAAVMCLGWTAMSYGQAVVSVEPATVESPAVGAELMVSINIAGGADVAGYQVTVSFDPTALSYASGSNADYLPDGAFAVPVVATEDSVTIAATSLAGAAAAADGTLATVTFTVVEAKASAITLTAVTLSNAAAAPLDVTSMDGAVTVAADDNLAAAIREALGLGEGAVITADVMRELTELDASFKEITALTGLEHAVNLTRLDLSFTGVSDVSLLANLTQLERLDLWGTGVSDVSPLANLTQLTYLDLDDTAVSDVSPLANLTQLEWLYLAGTGVSDVSPLANLTQLERLDLRGCPLSFVSRHTHIPALQAKGVVIAFDEQAEGASLAEQVLEKYGDILQREDIQEILLDVLEGLKAPNIQALLNPGTITLVVIQPDLLTQFVPGIDPAFVTLLKTDAELKTMLQDAQVQELLTKPAAIDELAAALEAAAGGTVTLAPTDADVNGDGDIDVDDLVIVAQNYGKTVGAGANRWADVNDDGKVDVADVLAVIAAVDAAGAPALTREDIELGSLQAADVRQWLRDAKQAPRERGIPASVGIAALERLLAALTRAEAPPSETVLLANYPNPFNPETWIPYELSEAAAVTVVIYASDGKLVRRLELGQVPAGVYQSRSRAAYWDGRNAAGEAVASGVYFYTLSAGDFSATRKMVIRK